MAAHEEFADDLALLAVGALPEAKNCAVTAHLETCAACRQELAAFRTDTALLALSTMGPKPPARSRERLLKASAQEGRSRLLAVSHARPWWAIAPMVASLALVIFGFLMWRENRELKSDNERLSSQIEEQVKDLERARLLVAMFTGPEVQRVTLVQSGETHPRPQVRAFFHSRSGRLMFLASNLEPLPSGKAYEMWVIPAEGAPIPAGLFWPDESGNAIVVNPPLPAGVTAKNFAVTIEPGKGSQTPTSAPVMAGSGM